MTFRTLYRSLIGALVVVPMVVTGLATTTGTLSDSPVSAANLAEPDAISFPSHGQEASPFTVDAWTAQQRTFPRGVIPANGYVGGMREAQQIRRLTVAPTWQELGPDFAPNANSTNPNSGASSAVSGRVSAIAVDPTTCAHGACSTIYVGAADGGVWKSTDAGKTWKPLLDQQLSTAVGSITLDPKDPNIIYVGTGEATLAGDSHSGIGILRTTDGGASWTVIGRNDFVNRAVGQIIVDPRTAGNTRATLYAVSTRGEVGGATTGGGSSRNNPLLPAIGFYKSTDGGQSWTSDNPEGAFEGAQSMVMDAKNPNVLYVGFEPDPRAHTAKPEDVSFYAAEGVYKTTDDGQTWTHETQGLPSLYFQGVTVAIAPSDPNVLYASYDVNPESLFSPGGAGADAHEELYKSTDAGSTWSHLTSAPDACDGQCYYDNPVAVDPTNPDVVYVGGTANYGYLFGEEPQCRTLYPLFTDCHATVMKTTDGGTTWMDAGENANSGPLHPDDHAIVLAPNDPSIVYTGNDGGIFHSSDGATNWNDLNHELGTLQFTGLGVGPDGTIYAGTQDNGTFKYTGSTTWQHIAQGDGGPAQVNPAKPSTMYHSTYGPILYRNDAGGDPQKDVLIAAFAGDLFIKGLGQFYEPYVLAPTNPDIMYYGTYRIWRSKIGGGTDGNGDGESFNDRSDKNDWVPISFDLRCASQPKDPTAVCNDIGLAGGRGIASIAVSPKDPNTVAAGASNGLVWLTRNALAPVKTDVTCSATTTTLGFAQCDYVKGPSWHQIDRSLPERYPTSLAFDPHSGTTLYATLSGFDQNTPKQSGHVFVSTDLGKHWKRIDGTRKGLSLPNIPFNDIVVNPVNGHLYVAADYGVYMSSDKGVTWLRIDQTLPQAPVYQMQYSSAHKSLVVATHGRGIWQTPAP